MAATTRSFLHAHHAHAHSAHRKKRTARSGTADDEALDEPPFISSSRDASEEDNDDADVDADAPSDGPSSPRTADNARPRRRSAPLGVIREVAPAEHEAAAGPDRSLLATAATAAAAAVAPPERAEQSAASAATSSTAAGERASQAPNPPEHAPPAVLVVPDSTPGLSTPRGELNPRTEATNATGSSTEDRDGTRATHRAAPQSDADASLASDEAPPQGGYTSASLSSRDVAPAPRYGHAHLDPHVPDSTTPYDGDVEFAARPVHPAPMASSAPPMTGGTAPSPVPRSSWGEHPERLESEQLGEPLVPASVSEIRTWFHDAIYRPVEGQRDYSISRPTGDGRDPARPVRIYADGVYDLFHYAHALQLRQAKLAFPCVHLIVGVCSSAACKAHKNEPVMSSAERYAAVANSRWVDEVLEDAPWVVDQNLLDALQIDYVAHDEEPYAGPAGAADVYRFVKDQGRFLPTRRTPGVSTSELLARIVDVYKSHALDSKLKKVADARSAAASLAASRIQSASQSRRGSQDEGRRT